MSIFNTCKPDLSILKVLYVFLLISVIMALHQFLSVSSDYHELSGQSAPCISGSNKLDFCSASKIALDFISLNESYVEVNITKIIRNSRSKKWLVELRVARDRQDSVTKVLILAEGATVKITELDS